MTWSDRARRQAWRWYRQAETSEHRLRYLFAEVTRRCNLACAHCGSDCGRDLAGPELDTGSWQSIFAYVHAWCDPFIVLTGGEPLVRPDLFDLTGDLGRRGQRWGLVSNGWALDGPTFERLVADGLTSLTLSIDGDEPTHRLLRRHPEAFGRVLAALELSGASGLEYKDAVTCVHPGNLDRLDAVAELLVARGLTSWRLFRIFPRGAAARRPDLVLDRAQTQALLAWIADRRPALALRGLDLGYSCEGWLPFDQDRRVRREPFFCRSGVSIASVLADGTLTGCNNHAPGFAEGHLATDDLRQRWNQGFERYRQRDWMRRGPCGPCPHWRDCQGGALHLWEPDGDEPAFCYARDLARPSMG